MIDELLINHPVCNDYIINDIINIKTLLGELCNKVNTIKVISNNQNIELFKVAMKLKDIIRNEIHNIVYQQK